jgi:putative transposase
VAPDTRDAVVDWVRYWSERSEFACGRVLTWLGIPTSKYYDWCQRYGQPNEHNAALPRGTWLQDWEKHAILDYRQDHPDEGYRRLTFMMLDADVVAVSPSSVYRVLKLVDQLGRPGAPSGKGTGFVQATQPHEHWHIDVSYLNICGTFYYLCSILDGYSRYIVHWEIRESMTEAEIETILQRGREACPGVTPRIISDNGPQFMAKDFKAFIRLSGMTHVRTSPYYPQSNGKIESWHKTVKRECLADARRVVARYVIEYNTVRLHSGIGYLTPQDRLTGQGPLILAERQRKLEQARLARRAAQCGSKQLPSSPELFEPEPAAMMAAPALS